MMEQKTPEDNSLAEPSTSFKMCAGADAEDCLSGASRLSNYGATISVSPYIKIWNRIRYKDFTIDCQKEVILYELRSHLGTDNLESKGITWTFELTERKNVHCHLLFRNYEQESMKCLQNKLAIKFGYAKDPIDRAFYFENLNEQINVDRWITYMYKDQRD